MAKRYTDRQLSSFTLFLSVLVSLKCAAKMASSSGSNLRIVLIGKNESENSRVGNTILGTKVFQSEASLNSQHQSQRISGEVEERHVTVIKTSHLLQTNLQQHQMAQSVSDCVSQCPPGAHVILVVLQFKDFNDTDRHRVKYVLNLFSKQALNHTIVLTTDEETLTSKLTSRIMNNSVHSLIKECGGGHLQFDETPGWRSELFRMIEEILEDQQEEFVMCDLYRDGGDGSSVDGDPENSEHKMGGKQNTNTGSDERVSTSGKAKLNIVLCGNNTTLKISVSKLFRGIQIKQISKPEKESKECVKKDAKINGCQINVIELPALTRLSEQEVMRQTLKCVSLCDPGVNLFIFVIPATPLTNDDKEEMEKINRTFYSKKHFMVLFTTNRTVDQSVTDFAASTESQRIVSLYGSWYTVMGLNYQRNSEKILKILNATDQLKTEPYTLQMFLRAQERRIRSEKEIQIKELQQRIKTLESENLNLVLCGIKSLKSFISNLILNRSERRSEFSSECLRTEVELNGRLIRLLELPDLIGLSEEEVMRQTLRCVSLCHPGVHLFLLIIPDAPLNNEDRAEIEEIQKIFSSRVNKHMMILIKQSSGDKKSLDEETQAVLQRFGGRQHFIEQNTQVSTLMKDIEQKVDGNGGEVYSTETFLEPQIEKLMKYEDMRRIHSFESLFQSQDLREREDELRIVLLGKTGVGKSATGNTILGKEEFISDISQTSVTIVCQKKNTKINDRLVTVIDTPGLFDTKLSNEEIKREISHCISMILPGPHVFLLLISLGRFTEEEEKSVKIIQETFGENSLKYTIVLFTRGDDLKNKTIEHFLGKSETALKTLIETCGNRVHVFNNNQTGDRTQVSELLEKIDNMVKTNGGSYYSCKMFREMERGIQEEEKKILMEKVERLKREKDELMKKHKKDKEILKVKEKQKYDDERKRREEEFNKREERNRRDIKEKEEEERKIREQLKREREEWEKQRQQQSQRREAEEERRRKKEEERLEKFYQQFQKQREDLQVKYEEEKRKIKITMEEQIQNRDKERKSKEEEHKKDIKDIEELERKMQKEMKKDREDWEKQTLESQQREEEEVKEAKIYDELYIEALEVHCKNNAEDTPPDPECLRIILFGRTGMGKSATGNTILRENVFHSEDSKNSVTTTCQKVAGKVDGRTVAVVDTPDLFDTSNEMDKNMTNKPEEKTEQVVEEMVKCVSLSAPGPHVFIIVLSVGRITQEDRDTLDMIRMIFGQKAADFTIVLFTRGDSLKKQTIEQYVEKSKNAELKKLISNCGNRFLAFNNTKTDDQTQVTKLLNMIEEVKKNNQGQYFSNEMFEEAAISVEERMKILEEKEKKNQDQVEKFKSKYEWEYENMRRRLKEKRENTEEEKEMLQMKFREREETLRREFEEKEKSEQKKREEEDQKRSELEKQLRDEYEEKLEEMKREIEDLRSEHKKRQEEREAEERKREEKYKEDKEKMKKEQEHIIAELRKEQEEEIKNRDSDKQMRNEEEEKKREEWRRKIEEAESEEKKMIEEQQREWEEEKKREMREREEEERMTKEKHKKQLREKQEELEKIKKRFESEREKERQMMEEERQKQVAAREEKEREYEEKLHDLQRHYEQQEEEREEDSKTREEDEERREEKRKRWEKMIEDLKQEQEEEIRRREKDERERIEGFEKYCDEIQQKHDEEIKAMKKKHEDEAKKQRDELNDFEERKKKHIEEFKGRIEEGLKNIKNFRRELKEKWDCHVM